MRRARPVTALIGAAIAIFAIAAPAARTGAAPAPACTASSGVTVVVDFTHFGRSIERGCAPGRYGTALGALQAAGFQTAGTANYGDAFVCRIDGLPAPKTEACAITPPARASWSFYYARPTDAAWTYSTGGVLSYAPPAGSLVAFAFGNYAKPGVRPPGAIATPPTTDAPGPQTTVAPATPVTTPVTAQATPPTTLPATLPAAIVPPVTIISAPVPTTPRRVRSAPTTSTPPLASPATPHVVDRTATGAVTHGNSGSPLPAVLTIAIVAVLGSGAAFTIRARRRREA